MVELEMMMRDRHRKISFELYGSADRFIRNTGKRLKVTHFNEK